MLDTAGIERGRTALDGVNLTALARQELGEKGAVLAGGASDQSNIGRQSGNPAGWTQSSRPSLCQSGGGFETYFEERFRALADATPVISHALKRRAGRIGPFPKWKLG